MVDDVEINASLLHDAFEKMEALCEDTDILGQIRLGSSNFIIRLYEAHGYDTEAVITFSHAPQSVQETDMLEWDKYTTTTSFPVTGNEAKIVLKKHEIKTLRVKM